MTLADIEGTIVDPTTATTTTMATGETFGATTVTFAEITTTTPGEAGEATSTPLPVEESGGIIATAAIIGTRLVRQAAAPRVLEAITLGQGTRRERTVTAEPALPRGTWIAEAQVRTLRLGHRPEITA